MPFPRGIAATANGMLLFSAAAALFYAMTVFQPPAWPSVLRVGFAGTSGLSADGAVAVLRFHAIGEPGDRTPLVLAVSDIDDPSGSPLPIELIDGEIVIAGGKGDNGVDGQGEPVSGDCDGDGVLTRADAVCALEMSVDLRPEDPAIDLNGDGAVTSGDARIILQRLN